MTNNNEKNNMFARFATQTIDKLVEDISERINSQILRSYLK